MARTAAISDPRYAALSHGEATLAYGVHGGVGRDLEDINRREPFHQWRWWCITKPERALEILGPHARLEVSIIRAQGLLPRDDALLKVSSVLNPAVVVFLDDAQQEGCHTSAQVNTTSPVWQFDCQADIISPFSMVRLQVTDSQPMQRPSVGFVEFRVSDLPYSEMIDGWLELRFQDNLKNTSGQRFSIHRSTREEDVTEHPFDTYPENVGMCTSQSSSNSKIQPNAGELHVRLRLVRTGTWLDSVFALALDTPLAANYGDYYRPDPKPFIDLQQLVDESRQFKVRLVSDALACLAYYMWYIMCWRSTLISALVMVSVALSFYQGAYAWFCIPGLLAVLLLLNGSTSLRLSMTRGGSNADLSEDGLQQVAAWESTPEMKQFIDRILQHHLEGAAITNEGRLMMFASHCFRDGRPCVSFQELRMRLAHDEGTGIAMPKTDKVLNKDDLVLVDDRYCAKVVNTDDNLSQGRVAVQFEWDGVEDLNSDGAMAAGQTCLVESSRVRHRTKMKNIPHWLAPQVVKNLLSRFLPVIEAIKVKVFPHITTATNVLTWRSPCASFGVFAFLALECYVAASEVVRLAGGTLRIHCGWPCRWGFWVIISFWNLVSFILFSLLLFLVFIKHAWGFRMLKSIGRICAGLCHRRAGPQGWAFFRADNAISTQRHSLNSQRSGGLNAGLAGNYQSGNVSMEERSAQLTVPQFPGAGAAFVCRPCNMNFNTMHALDNHIASVHKK